MSMSAINTILTTEYFNDWYDNLTDAVAKDQIDGRIYLAEEGNFGDCNSVGDGVSEMRIHYGPGYRLYYCQRGRHVYFLLVGGTKKGQQGDIKHAKNIKRELERGQ